MDDENDFFYFTELNERPLFINIVKGSSVNIREIGEIDYFTILFEFKSLSNE